MGLTAFESSICIPQRISLCVYVACFWTGVGMLLVLLCLCVYDFSLASFLCRFCVHMFAFGTAFGGALEGLSL